MATYDNYFKATYGVWRCIDSIPAGLEEAYTSESGSSYWRGEDAGGPFLIRRSDHWSGFVRPEDDVVSIRAQLRRDWYIRIGHCYWWLYFSSLEECLEAYAALRARERRFYIAKIYLSELVESYFDLSLDSFVVMGSFLDKMLDSASSLAKGRVGKHISQGLVNHHMHHTGTVDVPSSLLRERTKAMDRVGDAVSDDRVSVSSFIDSLSSATGLSVGSDGYLKLDVDGFTVTLSAQYVLDGEDVLGTELVHGLWLTVDDSSGFAGMRVVSYEPVIDDGYLTDEMLDDYLAMFVSFVALLRQSGSSISAITDSFEEIDGMEFVRYKTQGGQLIPW